MTGDRDSVLPADMDAAAVGGYVDLFVAITPVPDALPVRPRWWVTTDQATMDRITFLPDYTPFEGDMVVVGMRAAWQGGDVPLSCDPANGEYFRKWTTEDGTTYGRVFAPAPPPIGLWSGEWPDA